MGSPAATPGQARRAIVLPNNEQNTTLALSFSHLLHSPLWHPKDTHVSVKYITVKDTCIELTINHSYPANRLFLAHNPADFAVISFSQLWLGSGKASSKYIEQVLTNGVCIDGQRYHYLGQSNSQLQSRSCVLYRCRDRGEAAALLETWGCFASIDGTAKRAKRIGLLFSSISPVFPEEGRPIRHKVIDDVERSGFCFTDGCGYCSRELARRVSRKQRMVFRGEPIVPSVLQIRYRGSKGTVQVSASLDGSGYDLILRKSMLKFKEPLQTGSDSSVGSIMVASKSRGDSTSVAPRAVLGVVGYSQPYRFGSLNKQTLMLLSGLGVQDEQLLRLQEEHLGQVAAMTSDVEAAFIFLAANNEVEMLERLVEHGIDGTVLKCLARIQAKELELCRAKQKSLRLPSLSTQAAAAAAAAGSGEDVKTSEAAWQQEEQLADAAGEGGAPDAGEESSRLRILVRKSRLAYAVCDPTGDSELEAAVAEGAAKHGIRAHEAARQAELAARAKAAAANSELLEPLQYGECFFQPTIDGGPCILQDTFVVVVRNPCYHLGDLLVLQCVDKWHCRGLRDCLVLPTQGRRPHADESAGGDLDGDQFFVSWEPLLVPPMSRLQPAPLYPAARTLVTAGGGQEQLVRYFAAFDNRLVARMNAWYLRWADLLGPSCKQCAALALLFARGVDAVSTGVKDALPEHLKPPDPEGDSEEVQHCIDGRVWNVLLRRASAALAGYRQSRARLATASPRAAAASFDADGILDLLSSRNVCVSEYELLRLCAAWCRCTGAPLEQLALHIDFAQMDHLQKLWAIQAGVPRIIAFNALNQSLLLSPEEISSFGMGIEQLHWKLLAAGDLSDELAFHRIHSGLASFPRKLLVMQVGEPPASLQTVVLYLPRLLEPGERSQLSEDTLAFLFAGPFRRKIPLLHHRQSLHAELTSQRFQVFWNNQTGQSFLWLGDQVPEAQRLRGRGRGRWGRGPNVGRGEGRGRGRDRGSSGPSAVAWSAGPPPAAEPPHRQVLVSIAVAEFDRQAYNRGGIQQVRKTALHGYELYVISEARPLQPASLREPSTADAFFWEDDAAAATPSVGEASGKVAEAAEVPPLTPVLQPTEHADELAVQQAAEQLHAAASDEGLVPALHAVGELLCQLADAGKLEAAVQLLTQVDPDVKVPSAVLHRLLEASARFRSRSCASAAVERLLAQAAAAGLPAITSVAELAEVLESTGVLAACPTICILLWEQLLRDEEQRSGNASLPASAAVKLLRAAVAACGTDTGGPELLSSMLQHFRQIPRSLAALQPLLEACLRSCPDRVAAAEALGCLRQHWMVTGASDGPNAPNLAAAPWERQVSAYACNWALLLTLDLLAESKDAELAADTIAATSATVAPGAAALYALTDADSQPHVPPPSTLWDHLAAGLLPLAGPEVAARLSDSRGQGGQAAATRGGSTAAASPAQPRALVLCNLEAGPGRRDGQDTQPQHASLDAARLRGAGMPGTGVELTLHPSQGRAFLQQESLQVGDLVRLSDMATPSLQTKLPGCYVEGVILCSAIMEVKIELPWMPTDAQSRLWRLQRLCNLTTYERSLRALCSLEQLGDPGAALRLVVQSWAGSPSPAVHGPGRDGETGESAAADEAAAACNPSQLAAISVSTQRALSLIHGPPGTGKTHTVVHLLITLLEQRRKGQQQQQQGHSVAASATPAPAALPLLVTAGTNVAVDNILRKLLACLGPDSTLAQPGQLLRIGDAANVGKDLQRYCLEAQEGLRTPHGYDNRRMHRALRSSLAVFTTCAGAGSALLDGCRFGAVVVDEASQVVEPCTLVPLLRALPGARCVLVGDHQQLGPVVSREGQEQGLHVSLFERLQQCHALAPVLLDTQYRMHPGIAAFPNTAFYGGRLRSHQGTAASKPPAPLVAPVTFLDVPHGRESMGSSKVNLSEADAVEKLLEKLLSGSGTKPRRASQPAASAAAAGAAQRPLSAAGIGVITPYRAQADRLRSRTAGRWPELEISTVDAFQGREKEVIIISTVRANGCGRLGFVSDRRRLNVALTRAVRAVVVVGNRATLSSDTLWRSWLRHTAAASGTS